MTQVVQRTDTTQHTDVTQCWHTYSISAAGKLPKSRSV